MPTPPTASAALDELGIEAFCDKLIDGQSYTIIAKELGIGKSSIARWLAADAERSARAREALILSAATEADKAEAVLLGHVKGAGDMALDPATKRELAFHYRWLARVRNPRDYGEKLQVDSNHTIVNLSDEEIARRAARITADLEAAHQLPALPAPDAGGE